MNLTDSQVRSRFEGLVRHLDHWGDVVASDEGRNHDRRLLTWGLVAPGGGLSPEVRARYREYFRMTSGGDWELIKHTYEYLDIGRGSRLAFHLHDLPGRTQVPHAHCESASDIPEAERSPHLRSTEYELREAHHEFMTLYASERAPDCSRFLPLEIDRRLRSSPIGLRIDVTNIADAIEKLEGSEAR